MTSREADWSRRTAKKTAGTTVVLDDVVVVPVTPATAWTRLEDVPLVASCLPGLVPGSLVAESENVFRARMVYTVMGISANWDLKAAIEPDPARHFLAVTLEGEDTRLNMKLKGTAGVLVRAEESGHALLDYTANLRIDGSLAAMGGPVIRSILSDAIGQFVEVVGGQEPAKHVPWYVRFAELIRGWWARLTRRSDTSTT
ncbi:SRPBCC domain-containing protein [Streptomyces sp. NPDC047042]|uniref:CoxG family protein n=1 Tax=Streptomyces sp. NPDC047042 TaxID=3154807 RepID=UPI0033DC4384